MQAVYLGSDPQKWERRSEESDTKKEEESCRAEAPVSKEGWFCRDPLRSTQSIFPNWALNGEAGAFIPQPLRTLARTGPHSGLCQASSWGQNVEGQACSEVESWRHPDSEPHLHQRREVPHGWEGCAIESIRILVCVLIWTQSFTSTTDRVCVFNDSSTKEIWSRSSQLENHPRNLHSFTSDELCSWKKLF